MVLPTAGGVRLALLMQAAANAKVAPFHHAVSVLCFWGSKTSIVRRGRRPDPPQASSQSTIFGSRFQNVRTANDKLPESLTIRP